MAVAVAVEGVDMAVAGVAAPAEGSKKAEKSKISKGDPVMAVVLV
jgi:hypothetical protein